MGEELGECGQIYEGESWIGYIRLREAMPSGRIAPLFSASIICPLLSGNQQNPRHRRLTLLCQDTQQIEAGEGVMRSSHCHRGWISAWNEMYYRLRSRHRASL